MNFTIADQPERERFEARDAEGALAGVLTYQLTGPIIVLTHTQVDGGAEAEDALIRAALDDARDKGRTVVPMAPSVTAWIDSHSEYENLVARTTKKIK
ncbi:GNAT family N-acetyltransferase [Actinoplanes sp. NPDC049265]|uniref:GNAT family N-acetyltransferase n=1 Tax=Actinoplanes sp. NPDC049265 TaxID=3363902 RepID=UPI003716AC07